MLPETRSVGLGAQLDGPHLHERKGRGEEHFGRKHNDNDVACEGQSKRLVYAK